MNALDSLHALLTLPYTPLFNALLCSIIKDQTVTQELIASSATNDRLYHFLQHMKKGMEYSLKKWGVSTLPDLLWFEGDLPNKGYIRLEGIIPPRGSEKSETILIVTYIFIARMMHYGARGKRYYNDHIPEGRCVSVAHGIMLATIEECYHAFQLHAGMRPQSTRAARNDPMEQAIIEVIRGAIEELHIPLELRTGLTE